MKTLKNSVLLFLFASPIASASELAFSKNARTFETHHQSLMVKTLAYSCLALPEVYDGIPCNPAMTGKATKANLKAEGSISNGYSNLARTRKLLSGDIDQNTINDLFSKDRVLQVEAQADVMFTSRFLNSRLSPYSYKYFSVVRNDANPDVELFAVEEKELVVQSGFSYGNFDFGLEYRRVEWKFIRQRMKLLALATTDGINKIKPKNQTGNFFQPAANYNFNIAWNPRVAVMVANLGDVDHEYEEFKHPVDTQFGFGVSPPVPYGKLDVLIDYKSLDYSENDSEKLHLGLLYRYGAMNLGFGLDKFGVSSGVFYGLEQINAGILFTTTKLPWKEEDYYAQTVYVQVGWQL